VETISYSEFKQYISQGIAGELIIGPEKIKGTLQGSPLKEFATIRVDDPNLVKELDERRSAIPDGLKINF
jgi:cell division protease FtsH